MRENCTYGSMRGRAYPITRGVPLYSTPSDPLFLLNPRAVFTQATSSHAEMRPARFVVDPRLLASHLPGLAIQGSAATNASCPRYASRNAYLPYIMHGCDRFDLSRGRLRVASRSPSATSPPNYVLRRIRCNTQSTYCKFQVNRAGRRQIESVALCACRRHLRIISTL